MTKARAGLEVARFGLVASALSILACGGGGGGGAPIAVPCVTFTGFEAPGAGRVVSRQGPESTCDIVAVDWHVTDVEELFAGSFTVDFDPALVMFYGYSVTASVLAEDGAQVEALWNENSGRGTLGLTRVGVTSGVDVVGTGLLVRMYFRRLQDTGSALLLPSEGTLLRWGTPPAPIAGIRWVGGTVAIVSN